MDSENNNESRSNTGLLDIWFISNVFILHSFWFLTRVFVCLYFDHCGSLYPLTHCMNHSFSQTDVCSSEEVSPFVLLSDGKQRSNTQSADLNAQTHTVHSAAVCLF